MDVAIGGSTSAAEDSRETEESSRPITDQLGSGSPAPFVGSTNGGLTKNPEDLEREEGPMWRAHHQEGLREEDQEWDHRHEHPPLEQ